MLIRQRPDRPRQYLSDARDIVEKYEDYVDELEKYADELEKQNVRLSERIQELGGNQWLNTH